MSTNEQQSAPAIMTQEREYPFQFWWGVSGCLALVGVILLLAPYSEGLVLFPDKGDMWYFWQLNEPTWQSRASAWVGYFLHQVSIWYLIYIAQTNRPKYSKKLHAFNVLTIAVNIFFIGLHIFQSKVWYDGLAQDVPEWTSFASVAILLFMIHLIENQRRGLVAGKPVNWLTKPAKFLRKYHGYYFSWAILYTFWYHPIETTYGHLYGFFYIFLLMLQGSIFFTDFHRNRWWTLSLEMFVIIHAVSVAFYTMQSETAKDGWHFVFGFLAMFIVTQMHGLGLSKLIRWILLAVFIGAILLVYSTTGNWDQLQNILLIPVGSYMMVFVIAILLKAITWPLQRKVDTAAQ